MYVNLLDDGVSSEWKSVIRSTNLLLIDSNPASLVHAASLLQGKVHNVTTSGSATTALKLLKARKRFYHIVMTDYYLQDMNIFEFMKRIQHQCLTPIILMAGDCNIDLAKDALTKGASFFIQKPLVPSDLARLWFHILWLTEALPAATSSKQKKRTLINSEEGNGKQRKSQTTQGPSHLQEGREWGSLPSNPSTTPPSTNFVGYTLDGVQQKLKELQSINAVNRITGNGITNTPSHQSGGEMGRGLIFLERGHMTPTNDCVTGALQVPTQEAGVNLGRGMHCNGNGIVMNSGSCQVAGQNGGAQIFTGGVQVTSTEGYVTNSIHVSNQEPSDGLGNWIYHNNGNIMTNGSGQVGLEIGGGQILVEGVEVTQTNGCVTGDHEVPNQEAFGDFARGINGHENIMSNTGRGQVGWEIGGDELFKEGGQVHFLNEEASGDLDEGMNFNGNVMTNTGSDQLMEEIARAQAQISGDDIVELLNMVYDEEVTNPTVGANSTT